VLYIGERADRGESRQYYELAHCKNVMLSTTGVTDARLCQKRDLGTHKLQTSPNTVIANPPKADVAISCCRKNYTIKIATPAKGGLAMTMNLGYDLNGDLPQSARSQKSGGTSHCLIMRSSTKTKPLAVTDANHQGEPRQ
jgi:hypothetical protein